MQLPKKRQERVNDLPQLVERVSVLLTEGYTFFESVEILLPFHVREVEMWHKKLQEAIQLGSGPTAIFSVLGMPKRFLLSVEIAERTGDLAHSLQLLGAQMRFQQEARQRFRKTMMYPVMLFSFVTLLFWLFRMYFLPNMERLFYERTTDIWSIKLSRLFLFVPDYVAYLFVVLICLMFVLWQWLRKQSVAQQVSIWLKMPLIRYFWRLHLTKNFAQSLGQLLLFGLSLQEALHILKKQEYSQTLSYVAGQMEKRVMLGDSLTQSVQVVDYFYTNFTQFVLHGEKSGLLAKELLVYSELLTKRLQSFVMQATKIIQPLFLAIIAFCVIAAYLSILLPLYNMLDFV